MPDKNTTTHVLMQNELVIYRGERSGIWQCRYKVAGVWQRASAKQRDLKLATKAARERMIEVEATTVIAEGEVLQLLNIRDPDVTEARYLEVVRFKTAKLFEATALAGAVLASAIVNEQQQAAAYGRHLDTAFTSLMICSIIQVTKRP